PAYTARDVSRNLGIARNEFTDMANKYKAENKLIRKPLTFEVLNPKLQPWWIVRTCLTDQEGKVRYTDKPVMDCSLEEIYQSNSVTLIMVDLNDAFAPVIHDNIIITRTKSFEEVYYRILLVADDRIKVGDVIGMLTKSDDPLFEFKRDEIIRAISYLVRLNRLVRVKSSDYTFSVPESKTPTKKRVCLIVDGSVVSTLMTGIPKTDDIKRIAVHLFEVGRLTTDQVYDLICLIDLLNDQECTKSSIEQYNKFFEVAKSLVNIVKTLQHLICDEEVFGLCDGVEMVKMECLGKLSENEIETYRMKYTSAILGCNSRLVSVEHQPYCPQIVPHTVLNSYLFSVFLSFVYNSGVPTMVLPRGCLLQTLPKPFDEYPYILTTTFSHRQESVSRSNALLYLNEALKTQPVVIHALLTKRPVFERVVFPLEYSTSNMKNHPIIKMMENELGFNKFCGRIVLIKNNTTPYDKNNIKFEEWDLFEIVFGIPMDDLQENKQCVASLQKLLMVNKKDEMWNTSLSIVQLFFRFLEKYGFDATALTNAHALCQPMSLYPPQPVCFIKSTAA
ncbi:hypothetical protein EIN_084220, partial [Entamoeba invadens IP1]|uniref:hypothetical protein n=1 Tax=Entamoeba invadens IP1 TaxID=370355 RepID=UPI0002C3E978